MTELTEDDRYTQCRFCAHFVGPNPAYGDYPGIARYEHYEDGEQEFDHDPQPGWADAAALGVATDRARSVRSLPGRQDRAEQHLLRRPPRQGRRAVGRGGGRMRDIEDDRPEPDSLADIAAEHGVPEWALRAALADSHPDASSYEVISRAWSLTECGWERSGGRCDKPKGHAGRHRYFRLDLVQETVPPRAGARPRGDQEGDRYHYTRAVPGD